MPCHISYGVAGLSGTAKSGLPLEFGEETYYGETLAGAGVAAQATTKRSVITITADVDGYIAIGATPDATSANTARRRIWAKERLQFSAASGMKAAFSPV